MKALLDTHVFLWWAADDVQLSPKAREVISDPDNVLFLSVVSAWEIVIKNSLGKLPLPESVDLYIPDRMAHYGFEVMPVELSHTLQVSKLAAHHHDPFDRLLIAQSQTEAIPLITADRKFEQYAVKIIWCNSFHL